ncbi:MAG TPA: complex I NDUFA9 subunit family protein [Alphaproteobacteria bacterium]|jgi:NADH dehydrogenase
MAIKRVTVFGGSGFVGRHLVQRLARAGVRVAVAVRSPRHADFLRPRGDVGQIVPVAADILDDAAVAAAVAGSDGVVNLVGVLYQRGRYSFDEVHAEGAERVAKAAAAAGVPRLVHVSAIGADAQSRSAYARSKAAGEAAVRAAFAQATILRPSIVFGPEDDFFNRFAAMARLSPVLPLFGGGATRFQPVYVGDVADAIVNSLTLPQAAGRTFELGGPTVYSFEELMRLVLSETGREASLLKLPFCAADMIGTFAPLVPLGAPLLTRDQARLLRMDNVVGAGAAGFADLGLTPTAAEAILPTYLQRFRKGGGLTRVA